MLGTYVVFRGLSHLLGAFLGSWLEEKMGNENCVEERKV